MRTIPNNAKIIVHKYLEVTLPILPVGFVDKVLDKCEELEADPLLIAAIIGVESGKKPELITKYKNPANLRTKESDWQDPIQLDDLDRGIHRAVQMIKLVQDEIEVKTVDDIAKVVRPMDPFWTDRVQSAYLKMDALLREKIILWTE